MAKRLMIVVLGAGLVMAAMPAAAAPRLTPKMLIGFYKQECADNFKELKGKLAKDKVKIAGTQELASKSPELACNFDASNPTIKKMQDKAWLAETEAFISKSGVDDYAKGAMKTMAINIAGSGVDKILAKAKAEGLTAQEIHLLGQITRAMAFTEAHVLAARKAFKK